MLLACLMCLLGPRSNAATAGRVPLSLIGFLHRARLFSAISSNSASQWGANRDTSSLAIDYTTGAESRDRNHGSRE